MSNAYRFLFFGQHIDGNCVAIFNAYLGNAHTYQHLTDASITRINKLMVKANRISADLVPYVSVHMYFPAKEINQ